jgi:hypothetical protein
MPLADDIRALRDRTIADLTAVHDYFFQSEVAWGLAGQALSSNPTLAFQNPVTGTTVSGSQLITRAAGYVADHLSSATFQQFLSIFEVFVGDLLRLWLTAFPRAVGGKTVKLEEALDAGDLPTLIARLVDHEIAEVTYKSPRTVFQYLERRIGLPLPSAAKIDQLAEAKAARDVLIHNRGVVDAGYLTKAGTLARYAVGQQIDIPKPYHVFSAGT